MRKIVYAFLPAMIVTFVDQFTKYLVVKNLFLHESVKILGDYIKITFLYNEKGLFGLSFGPSWIYYILPVAGIAFVIYLISKTDSKFYLVLLGVILGGGMGNIIDRVVKGKVVDFIDMGIGNLRWYTFNVADASIVISVIIIVVKETFFKEESL